MTEEVSAQERLRVVPFMDLTLPDAEAFEALDPGGESELQKQFGTLGHVLQIRFDWQNEPIATKTFTDFIKRSVELYEEAGEEDKIGTFPKKVVDANRRKEFAGNIAALVDIIDPRKVGYSQRIQLLAEELDTHSLNYSFGKGLKEEEFFEYTPRAADYGALADAYLEIATGKARRDFFKGYNLL